MLGEKRSRAAFQGISRKVFGTGAGWSEKCAGGWYGIGKCTGGRSKGRIYAGEQHKDRYALPGTCWGGISGQPVK